MSRKEFIAASAWDDNLTATSINNRESGFNLSTNNNCNTMSGSGLTYSNGALPTTGNEDTLPANSFSSIRTIRTGSQVTKNCSSRFGIQDLIGNVREWNLEKYNSCYVGSDTTLAKAYLKQNGILFTAKRLGASGNRIMVRIINDSSNTVTVNQDSSYLYIDVKVTLGSITAAQVANLIQSSSEALALVDLLVYNSTFVQTAYTTALAGGNNGTSSGVTGYTSQATLSTIPMSVIYDVSPGPSLSILSDNEYLKFTSNVYGIYSNDITISFVEGTSESILVKNGKDIEVTFDNETVSTSAISTYESIKNLLNANAYVSNLITTSVVRPAMSVGDTFEGYLLSSTALASFTSMNLTGGSAPSCKAASITSPSWVNDVFNYGYGFDGMFGSGNGPGSGSTNISSWILSNNDANNFNAKYFHLPLGLPSINSIDDALEIGPDISVNDMHGDQIDVNIDPFTYVNANFRYGPNRAVASGGGWYGAFERSTNAQGVTGNKAGRYSMDLLPTLGITNGFPDLFDEYTGFRCVTEAP
jgi:hypothetical protein